MPRKRARRQDRVDKAATEQFRTLRTAYQVLKSTLTEPQTSIMQERKQSTREARTVPLLLALFRNDNGLTRATAAQLVNIDNLPAQAVIASFPTSIDAKVDSIRATSARLLGGIGEDVDVSAREKIAAAMLSSINEGSQELRLNVIEAFGSLGNVAEGAVLLLLGIAKDGLKPESNTEAIRIASLRSLTRLSSSMPLKVQKEIADTLIVKLDDASEELRKEAPHCLTGISAEHTVGPLFEQLKSRVKSAEYRSNVVTVLNDIATINDLQVKEKIFAFLEPLFLEEADASVKAAMESALGDLKRSIAGSKNSNPSSQN